MLLFPRGAAEPVLVAKVPRLPHDGQSVAREADLLKQIQATRAGGWPSIPRVIAIESAPPFPLLIESAIAGPPLSPAAVRHEPERCCARVTAWLVDMARPERLEAGGAWVEALIEQPLRDLAERVPLAPDEATLLARTLELVEPLRAMVLPAVIEHGDLSHPNLVWRADGSVGVIDWEGATPCGLPACDLFFFLSYVGLALDRATDKAGGEPSLHAAFFAERAWARRWVRRYAGALALPEASLTPLFVAGWARYLARLVAKLGDDLSPAERAHALRDSRAYRFWRYTLGHLDQLRWDSLPD